MFTLQPVLVVHHASVHGVRKRADELLGFRRLWPVLDAVEETFVVLEHMNFPTMEHELASKAMV